MSDSICWAERDGHAMYGYVLLYLLLINVGEKFRSLDWLDQKFANVLAIVLSLQIGEENSGQFIIWMCLLLCRPQKVLILDQIFLDVDCGLMVDVNCLTDSVLAILSSLLNLAAVLRKWIMFSLVMYLGHGF